MKKIILLAIILSASLHLYAQTNGGNNQNSGYQNPYQTHPYQNPYGNNNSNTNIFERNDEQPQKDNGLNNEKKLENADQQKDIERDNKSLNFNDRNNIQNYSNDPDYLEYKKLVEKKELEELDKDSIINDSAKNPENQVYGANFLSNTSADNYEVSTTLTTVPENYRLGIGDEIIVSVYGAAELQQSYTISKDGSIFPNQVGKIYLQGLSFQAARDVVAAKFRRVLPPNSNIDILIGKVRTIRVYVYGEVKRPGLITMSALNTPISALQRAGGLNEFGNLRDIQIRRNGIVIEHIDIYHYLKTGSLGSVVYLEDNDIITVGLYNKIVTAKGAFKRPMKYQLTEYEGIHDLIELAGGIKFDGRKSNVRVNTIFNEKEQIIDLSEELLRDGDYILKDGDLVTVNNINEGVTNTLTIEGAVAYPDVYQVITGQRIFEIIKNAGGLSPTAYKPRAFVFRNGENTTESKVIKISLNNIDNPNDEDNIMVKAGDVIRIISETQFDENFFVDVRGMVRQPGKKTYKTNLVLKDVLLMAGGLELDAENGRIEISNITDTFSRYSITGNNVNVREIAVNANLEIDEASENIRLKPYDIIYVRKKKDIILQKNVFIIGEVDYTGSYALLGDKERITSMLIRTGGLTENAYPEGAKLYRENVGQLVINLKDAMRNTGGKDDIILKDGDTIIIPKRLDFVRISGEVQMPVNVKFDNDQRSATHYIDAAGGFGTQPWRKRVTVRYQNGRLKSTKNFMFLHFYPKVKPGSVVNVPRRPDRPAFDINNALQYALTTVTSVVTLYVLLKN